MRDIQNETIKVIHVPDMWQGYKDNPSAYVLVRIEQIEFDGVPVYNSITDSFYLLEDDAKWVLRLDHFPVEIMPREKYFAWFRANS